VPIKLSTLALPSLLIAASACQSVDMERVQEINPFKRNQAEAPAPVRTRHNTSRVACTASCRAVLLSSATRRRQHDQLFHGGMP
jgi:hypothetical protein